MYSYEDRMRAVELYIKLGQRVRPTIRQLGYPTKNALKGWYQEGTLAHPGYPQRSRRRTAPVPAEPRRGIGCKWCRRSNDAVHPSRWISAYRNDKRLVELTDQLLTAENALQRSRAKDAQFGDSRDIAMSRRRSSFNLWRDVCSAARCRCRLEGDTQTLLATSSSEGHFG